MTASGSGVAVGAWAPLRGAVKGLRKQYSQDAWRVRSLGEGRAVVLAVADGHGSAAHFRSDLGARWAVEEFAGCAHPLALAAVRHGEHPAEWSRLRDGARRLPREVVHRWRERVLLQESNSPARGGISPDQPPFDAYGSTLVGAVVTPHLLMAWQLGDGDLVLVDAGGQPHTPFRQGPDLGDETESLCQTEAWRRMRTYWQPFTDGGRPPSVLLSTDGLSKSFADHQGFLDFAVGLCQRVDASGLPAVQAQLADWLARAAAHSGDDTTLVAAFPVPDQTGAAHPEGTAGEESGERSGSGWENRANETSDETSDERTDDQSDERGTTR